MPLSNSQYDTIFRNYEQKQIENRHLLENRSAEIYAAIPAYYDIELQIASVSVAQGKKVIEGDETALADLQATLRNLSAQKQQLLRTAGYPADYLAPVYECPDCRDTGYIGGVKCHCFKQAIISLLYEQSNISKLLLTENFAVLSYDYYQGEDLAHFQKAVTSCKEFIKNFSSLYRNLLFYGTVGTGKSFLSSCIAKELLDKGNSILYFSATQLFETLAQNSFDYHSKDELQDMYEDIFHCDLMIIDDLGTEMTNSFISSHLFLCLNERHMRKKATIISTNLSLEELQNRYSDRIFSRLISNYDLCKLSGRDIRMQKKVYK